MDSLSILGHQSMWHSPSSFPRLFQYGVYIYIYIYIHTQTHVYRRYTLAVSIPIFWLFSFKIIPSHGCCYCSARHHGTCQGRCVSGWHWPVFFSWRIARLHGEWLTTMASSIEALNKTITMKHLTTLNHSIPLLTTMIHYYSLYFIMNHKKTTIINHC